MAEEKATLSSVQLLVHVSVPILASRILSGYYPNAPSGPGASMWYSITSGRKSGSGNSNLILQGDFHQLDWITSNFATYGLGFSAHPLLL